jgi:hypothetical protein
VTVLKPSIILNNTTGDRLVSEELNNGLENPSKAEQPKSGMIQHVYSALLVKLT